MHLRKKSKSTKGLAFGLLVLEPARLFFARSLLRGFFTDDEELSSLFFTTTTLEAEVV